MKTISVTEEQPELRKLVEEAYGGAEVVLAYGAKMVKLERYEAEPPEAILNPEQDSPELEAELLKGVRSKITPYSRKDLETIAERVRREKASQ